MITVIKPSEGRKEHFNQKTICRCLQSYVDYEHDEDGNDTEEIEDEGIEDKLYLCVAGRFDEQYYQRVNVYILSESDEVKETQYQYCLETGDIGFGSVFKNRRNIVATTDVTLHEHVRGLNKKELEELCENYNA